MTTSLGTRIHIDASFADALQRTRDELKAEGFGVLTEVDLKAAFKEKLDREFRPYVILGACNPPLAYRALEAEPEVGLLLPCNVTVEASPDGGCDVNIVDPVALMGFAAGGASAELVAVANEAQSRLTRVAQALAHSHVQ